ncbi:MAG: gliding motility-associated transport system permease protein [bacterium]|nr:gliding motility-associated transport system permease protein [bacterium]
MGKIFSMFRKDLKIYLLSPLAYTVVGAFLLVVGYFYINVLAYYILQVTRWGGYGINSTKFILYPIFQNVLFLLIFLVPVLTMRSFPEEESAGTFELLLTSPITEFQIVMGKFLSSYFIYCVALAILLYIPITLSKAGELDVGLIVSGYVGMLLAGAAFFSAGIFTASLTKRQATASMLAFALLILLWFVNWAASNIGTSYPILGEILWRLALFNRVRAFSEGVIDLRNVVFFISLTVLFLYLSVISLASRRWK